MASRSQHRAHHERSMIRSLMRETTLAIQARSGVSPAVLVWLAVIALASATAFVFLCVTAYDWLTLSFGSTAAGLSMTAIFVAIAAIAIMLAALARRRVRERAILERASRAHAASWL